MTPHRILQIIPAPGWCAQYHWKYDDGEEEDTENMIVAWALVEWDGDDGKFRSVEGIENEDGETHLCSEYEGHRGYVYRPDFANHRQG